MAVDNVSDLHLIAEQLQGPFYLRSLKLKSSGLAVEDEPTEISGIQARQFARQYLTNVPNCAEQSDAEDSDEEGPLLPRCGPDAEAGEEDVEPDAPILTVPSPDAQLDITVDDRGEQFACYAIFNSF